jgi:hypothetical protein
VALKPLSHQAFAILVKQFLKWCHFFSATNGVIDVAWRHVTTAHHHKRSVHTPNTTQCNNQAETARMANTRKQSQSRSRQEAAETTKTAARATKTAARSMKTATSKGNGGDTRCATLFLHPFLVY